jgi:hypothetical protein
LFPVQAGELHDPVTGDAAEQEMADYATKGCSAVKMRAEGQNGFTMPKSLRNPV